MDKTMQQSIKEDLGLLEEEIQEAYYYLFDEFGFTIDLWEEDKLKSCIKGYWRDRGRAFEDD